MSAGIRPPQWTVKLAIGVFVALVVLSIAVPVFAAELEGEFDNAVLRLTTDRCQEAGALKNVPQDHRSLFYAGHGVVDGKEEAFCWALGKGFILIMWSDGTSEQISAGKFEWVQE